ncbi:hypothetical protein IWW34DRAFT_744988 [Fusarium oxysporum f. sp. albedinis]|nr:hypothetical protein IWW34DRAFT_744988 [Fusarium oxysporum f. sp. albedinis]
MQYVTTNDTKNVNKLRLITFHPDDVVATGIRLYIYTDILSSGGWLDYGELGVGNTQLYISATLYGPTSGLMVFRVPISALNVVGSYTHWQTNANDGAVAQGSRLAQNPGADAFWAGHSDLGKAIRVFNWSESSTSHAWIDVSIDHWPADISKFVSACPIQRTQRKIGCLAIRPTTLSVPHDAAPTKSGSLGTQAPGADSPTLTSKLCKWTWGAFRAFPNLNSGRSGTPASPSRSRISTLVGNVVTSGSLLRSAAGP